MALQMRISFAVIAIIMPGGKSKVIGEELGDWTKQAFEDALTATTNFTKTAHIETKPDLELHIPKRISQMYAPQCDLSDTAFTPQNKRYLEDTFNWEGKFDWASHVGLMRGLWEALQVVFAFLTAPTYLASLLPDWQQVPPSSGGVTDYTGTEVDGWFDPAALGVAAPVVLAPPWMSKASRTYVELNMKKAAVKGGVNMPWSAALGVSIFVAQILQGVLGAWMARPFPWWYFVHVNHFLVTTKMQAVLRNIALVARLLATWLTLTRWLGNGEQRWFEYPWTRSDHATMRNVLLIIRILHLLKDAIVPVTVVWVVLPYTVSYAVIFAPAMFVGIGMKMAHITPGASYQRAGEDSDNDVTLSKKAVDFVRAHWMAVLFGLVQVAWAATALLALKGAQTETYLCTYSKFDIFTKDFSGIAAYFGVISVIAGSGAAAVVVLSCFTEQLQGTLGATLHYLWIVGSVRKAGGHQRALTEAVFVAWFHAGFAPPGFDQSTGPQPVRVPDDILEELKRSDFGGPAGQQARAWLLEQDENLEAPEELPPFKELVWVLRDHRGVTVEALSASQRLQWASQRLQDDDETVRHAVENNGDALQFASKRLRDDETIVQAAVKNARDALKWASKRLRDDETIVRHAVENAGGALEWASDRLRDDETIVRPAVENDWSALQWASDRLRDDETIVRHAVENRGENLEWASDRLRDDETIVRPAVENDFNALRWASKRLRDDETIVRLAVGGATYVLEWASQRLQDDYETVRHAVENSGNALQFASKRLRDDETIVRLAVGGAADDDENDDVWRYVLQWASDRLRDDETIVRHAIENHGENLEWASDRLRDDETIVRAAIEKCAYMFKYASERLRDDETIVRHVAENDGNLGGYALEFASKRLQDDETIVRHVVERLGRSFKYASERLRDDETIVLHAVECMRSGRALEYASERLRDDEKFVRAAIEKDAHALRYASERLRGILSAEDSVRIGAHWRVVASSFGVGCGLTDLATVG